MFIYYNKITFEIFAIAEKFVINVPNKNITSTEYKEEPPKDIQRYLFDGGKFFPVPELTLLLRRQEQQNQFKIDYLELTDWYIVRNIEVGTEIPPHIKHARYQCRTEMKSPDQVREEFYLLNPNKAPIDVEGIPQTGTLLDQPNKSDTMKSHGMKKV